MNASETTSTPSWIRSLFLLFGTLGLFALAGAVPAMGVTHAYRSPLSFKWTRASGPVDHYNVYLSVDGKPFKPISQVQNLNGKGYQFIRVRVFFQLDTSHKFDDPVPYLDRLDVKFDY